MGDLFDVLGCFRFSPLEACPSELKGQIIKLKSKEGQVYEIVAEAACISASVRRQVLQNGTEDAIEVPLKKAVLAKVIDYFKHHKDHPAGEIVTPLPSNDLAQCGASRWDAKFVEGDKSMLFDLNLAATMLDIAGLFFLTSAKAAVMIKDKSSEKLRKEFGMTGDLPKSEEEMMSRELKAAGKNSYEDASTDIAALAVTLQATAAAAEKQGCLEATRGENGNQLIDPKSWRHACWRAAVLLDWKQLASAPKEVRGDRDLMFGALMTSQGQALEYASPALRADRTIVLEATKYFGTIFSLAADELRGDRDFVKEAIQKHGAALTGALPALQSDRGLILESAKQGYGSALQGASDALKRDADFVLEVAAQDPQACKHASEELRNDKKFALRAASQSGRTLQFMPDRFKADREVVAAAVGEDVAAALFAHTARRQELGIDLPWDSENLASVASLMPGKCEPVKGKDGALYPLQPFEDQHQFHTTLKAQKVVQFSASSTMFGNFGQANYTAANVFLDKMPAYERPELDSVTLMWGAVGNIGMRWKAFASQDMLNATPDALLSVKDASMILTVTCCKMETPEWYTTSLMTDMAAREAFLTVTSGGGSGGHWMPSESQPAAVEWKADGLGKGFLLGKDLEDSRAPNEKPLGGWLGLHGVTAGGREFLEPKKPPPRKKHYPLEVGSRVELVGLSAKEGATAILLKSFADGRWKLRFEDGTGNGLLKGCYLRVVAPASEVSKQGITMDELPPRRAAKRPAAATPTETAPADKLLEAESVATAVLAH